MSCSAAGATFGHKRLRAGSDALEAPNGHGDGPDDGLARVGEALVRVVVSALFRGTYVSSGTNRGGNLHEDGADSLADRRALIRADTGKGRKKNDDGDEEQWVNPTETLSSCLGEDMELLNAAIALHARERGVRALHAADVVKALLTPEVATTAARRLVARARGDH